MLAKVLGEPSLPPIMTKKEETEIGLSLLAVKSILFAPTVGINAEIINDIVELNCSSLKKFL